MGWANRKHMRDFWHAQCITDSSLLRTTEDIILRRISLTSNSMNIDGLYFHALVRINANQWFRTVFVILWLCSPHARKRHKNIVNAIERKNDKTVNGM